MNKFTFTHTHALESTLDLTAIYTLGRAVLRTNPAHTVSQGRYILRDGAVTLGGAEGANVHRVVRTLAALVNIARDDLDVNFAELSLFDPSDPTGRTFYLLLVGHDDGVIRDYQAQFDKNREEMQLHPEERTRSSLIPNPLLYSLPCCSAQRVAPLPCDPLDLAKAWVLFSAYAIEPLYHVSELAQTLAILKVNLDNFMADVIESSLHRPAGAAGVDTGILVTFPRPVGADRSDSELRLRGGGLFLFGQRIKAAFQLDELGMRLASTLNRAVMRVSYSQAEVIQAIGEQSIRAFAMEAHEIKKIIRFISAETPAFVLDEIRQYFNTIFAATFDTEQLMDSLADLPPDFAAGDTFPDFVRSAMLVASRIELMAQAMKAGKCYSDEKSLGRAAAEEAQRLVFRSPGEGVQLPPGDEHGLSTRWLFCLALVCALRNVTKHSDPGTPIQVVVEAGNGRPLIALRNHCRTRLDLETGTRKKVGMRRGRQSESGKTLDTLRHFVEKFGEDATRVALAPEELDGFDYVTRIPLPFEFPTL